MSDNKKMWQKVKYAGNQHLYISPKIFLILTFRVTVEDKFIKYG